MTVKSKFTSVIRLITFRGAAEWSSLEFSILLAISRTDEVRCTQQKRVELPGIQGEIGPQN